MKQTQVVTSTGLEDALAVVGDRWSFLVLRDIGLGIDRFSDLLLSTGAPRAVLAGRLHALTEKGLVATVPYREPGRRLRERYLLTDAGAEFRFVLAALAAWGERHSDRLNVQQPGQPAQPGDSGRALVNRHRGCGGTVRPRLTCECGEIVEAPHDLLTEITTRGAA